MSKKSKITLNRLLSMSILSAGIILVISSAFFSSAFFAILGTSLIFWSIILLYITPEKNIPLKVFATASKASLPNIQRILTENNTTQKGIYLPPKNLRQFDSSLIFIPNTPTTSLPAPEENSEKLFSEQKNGLFLTPPGMALCDLFEKESGGSFSKIDFENFRINFQKVLVDALAMSENVEITVTKNKISVEITSKILNGIYGEMGDQSALNSQVGCLLSSAIACALAKTTGKPIIIQDEIRESETKVTIIYEMYEVVP